MDGEVVERDVEELDGAVTGSYHDLVFMRFGPGEVVEGILSVKPLARVFRELFFPFGEGLLELRGVPFFCYDTFGCQTENVEPAVTYETEVCGGGDGDAGVEEGGIFHRVAIEALGTEFEHLADFVFIRKAVALYT